MSIGNEACGFESQGSDVGDRYIFKHQQHIDSN